MKLPINKIPDIFFDVEKIKFEYETYVVEHLNFIKNKNDVIVHSFCSVYDGEEKDILEKMVYTKEVIAEMKSIYTFRTVTFRVIYPNMVYTLHTDKNHGFKNWHIPIQSNDGCMFVFQSKNLLMPADGSLYEVSNINLQHTFINAGKEDRIHLLFET